MSGDGIDRGEVTVVDPLSIDPITGEIRPWWDDAMRRFEKARADWRPRTIFRMGVIVGVGDPEPDEHDLRQMWDRCEKLARQKADRAERVRVPCPTCHGKGTVLRSFYSKDVPTEMRR